MKKIIKKNTALFILKSKIYVFVAMIILEEIYLLKITVIKTGSQLFTQYFTLERKFSDW